MSLINTFNGSYCGLIKLYKCVAFIATPRTITHRRMDNQMSKKNQQFKDIRTHQTGMSLCSQEMRKLKSHTKLDKHII